MKIFDAIQQVTPCPKTKSIGCQCDRIDTIKEAEANDWIQLQLFFT